jgi:Tat protein translocase TatB subunit
VTLLFLESIGTTELLLIIVVALVVFGPRRLPEIGRKIGKGMADFRRASDDFKRTWEREVELERTTESARLNDGDAMVAADVASTTRDEEASAAGPYAFESENSIARGGRVSSDDEAEAVSPQPEPAQPAAETAAPRQEQLGKADWL